VIDSTCITGNPVFVRQKQAMRRFYYMQDVRYKAIRYIRLSISDGYGDESNSISNQRKIMDDFLSTNPDIEAVGEKVDEGYSGVTFIRPGFADMMDIISQGNANCIITKDMSRFGREFVETLRYIRRILPSFGVRFIAITDGIDTLHESVDNLLISFRTLLNDSYIHDISKKTRIALATKRANGDYVGACQGNRIKNN